MIGTQKAVGRALVRLAPKSSKGEENMHLSCALQSPAQQAYQASRTRGQALAGNEEVVPQVQSRYAMGAI